MKKAMILFLPMLLCMAVTAQDKLPAGAPTPAPAYQSPEQIVQQIVRVTSVKYSFKIKEGSVKNIEASISRRKRVITYNPEYLGALSTVSGSRWTVIALFAHEIGHHLHGHTLGRGGSKPSLEIEADEFAGYVLGRMGAALDESTLVMNYIANTRGSRTHPPRADRITAITRGWNRGTLTNQLTN